MSGFGTDTVDHLIRSNLWSTELKEVLEDELFAMQFVDMVTGFSDGDTWYIPSIGQMETYDYDEGQDMKFTAFDTGNFTFSITEYKASATYIYDKFKQDSFYMDRVQSSFVPRMQRALMKAFEVDTMALAPNYQTADDSNTINGAKHRWVASGTNEVINIDDFAKARFALQKANVPMTNLVAIVDPSVEFELSTLSNLTNMIQPHPAWEGVLTNGLSSGIRFVNNIYGFDVYVSQNLKANTGSETIDSVTATSGVNNLFFSAAPEVLPFIGSIRQPARVESQRNANKQRDEYFTSMRYGLKVYRPEAVCCVVSDTDQVYS